MPYNSLLDLLGRAGFGPRGKQQTLRHSAAMARANGSNAGALFRARRLPTLSLGSNPRGSLNPCFPYKPGKIGAFRLSKRRWHLDHSRTPVLSLESGFLERGHSVSLLRPTYPRESSRGSAGTFQRGIPQPRRISFFAAQPDTTGRPGRTRRTFLV